MPTRSLIAVALVLAAERCARARRLPGAATAGSPDSHRHGAEGARGSAEGSCQRDGCSSGDAVGREDQLRQPTRPSMRRTSGSTSSRARKLSNAFFRGVGSSPANPGVTTYIDGVPQLNANASNIEFTGIEQVEFVRGPQSALFGRNTLGGCHQHRQREALARRVGRECSMPRSGISRRERSAASASGPLSDRLALGFSFGHSARDGFTVNDVTGNDLDSRSATFGKAQLLWTPSKLWETRVIVSGERARDGDYALGDLEAVRDNPFHVAHDFEGHTDRDIFNTTIHNRYEGGALSLTSTTGFVNWSTEDETDLDYTPFPAAVRRNNEEAFQFTQEVRVASAAAAPIALSSDAAIKWQAGRVLLQPELRPERGQFAGAVHDSTASATARPNLAAGRARRSRRRSLRARHADLELESRRDVCRSLRPRTQAGAARKLLYTPAHSRILG